MDSRETQHCLSSGVLRQRRARVEVTLPVTHTSAFNADTRLNTVVIHVVLRVKRFRDSSPGREIEFSSSKFLLCIVAALVCMCSIRVHCA